MRATRSVIECPDIIIIEIMSYLQASEIAQCIRYEPLNLAFLRESDWLYKIVFTEEVKKRPDGINFEVDEKLRLVNVLCNPVRFYNGWRSNFHDPNVNIS
eukprot:400573_1